MPESPESRIIAEGLQKYLPGYYITSIESTDYNIPLPLPRLIKGITVKGKKLVFMLDQDIYLVNSLGMTGRWVWEKAPHARVTISLSKLVNNELVFAGNLYYDDTRKFGNFTIYNSTQELLNGFKGKVGPDLLNETVPYELWYSTVKKLKTTKQICQFLLDQQYFSGIGNVYRSEIAYHAKLNPTRLLSSLSESELKQLYDSSIAVLRDSYSKRAYSGNKIWDPLNQPGQYDPMVYNKLLDPHGNPVQTTTCKDKRKLYWVPQVQT